MTEKTSNWISVGVILAIANWIYRNDSITEQQYLLIIFVPLSLGVVYRTIAWRHARLVVIERRRLLKDLWRRGEKGEHNYSKYEKEIIALLGRIKMAVPYTIGFVIIVLGITIYHSIVTSNNVSSDNSLFRIFAPSLSLGSIFLGFRLHKISNDIRRALPPDSKMPFPKKATDFSSGQNLRVEIDRYKVHDFIAPEIALPFWKMQEIA